MTLGRTGIAGCGGRRRTLPVAVAAAFVAALALAPVAASAATGESIVAAARGRAVPVYRVPNARRPFLTLSNPSSDGGQLVFLVNRRRAGWERVYLPVRPNGSVGWVRDRDVDLALDPYRLVVSLGAHRLELWRGKRLLESDPVGVGRSVTPTPVGTYFLVELLKQPDPHGLYGPFAFGTSAYSNVLYSFGGGPGQIGLHGTDNPRGLGTDVSHGCIRIDNAAIARFARLLPLGTPIEIRR